MKYKIFLIFLFVGILNLFGQVNAGGNRVICGVSTALHGTGTSGATFNWTIVSKPSGASDPIFSNPTILRPTVSGMNTPGPYTFRVTQNLSGQITTSDVTITSTGNVSSFSAGNDITTISATTGIATLSGTIPNGYTASWSYYNISEFERYGSKINKNATMSNINSANPTLELTKKANHDIDPAYRVVLRITSIYDPNCWYEDDAIVRFIPNQKLVFTTNNNRCYSLTNPLRFINLDPSSPVFSTDVPNASGNPAFGTTVTVNPISQPAGANISFKELLINTVYFNGVTVVGTYVFTVTISNANGTHTTPQITYNYNGNQPEQVSFLGAAYPEQMMLYTPGGSGMRFYDKSIIGTSAPLTVYFKINSLNSPTVTTIIKNSGEIPPGGNPTLALNGDGTMNRSIVATPPIGGWQAGTYRINIVTRDGTCSISQDFYIHISDGKRKDVQVNDLTVCYLEGGNLEATIPLPDFYQGVENNSYLQGFTGGYTIKNVSKPNGSFIPTYDPATNRTFKNTTTKISNLNKEGEYVFEIEATAFPGGVDPRFIQKEYENSGAKYKDTFSVFVTKNTTANAGEDYTTTSCAPGFPLLGNQDSGPGKWTVVSAPNGVNTSNITFSPDTTPESPYIIVNGASVTGDYTFRWSVGNNSCASFDDVKITVADNMPEPIIIVNNTDRTVRVSNYHPTHIYTLPSGLSIDNNGNITGFELNKEYTIKVRPYGTDENTNCFSEGTFIVKEACTNPGLGGTPDGYTTIGITTQTKQQAWPENIPNGLIALESTTKGMVITRVQNSAKITDPKEGMLIYNIDVKCVQLYNGTTWKCIENECKLNIP